MEFNLDTMTPEELENTARVFDTLSAYSRMKARAMRNRLTGHIDEAMDKEQQCDKFYAKLPEWAKW